MLKWCGICWLPHSTWSFRFPHNLTGEWWSQKTRTNTHPRLEFSDLLSFLWGWTDVADMSVSLLSWGWRWDSEVLKSSGTCHWRETAWRPSSVTQTLSLWKRPFFPGLSLYVWWRKGWGEVDTDVSSVWARVKSAWKIFDKSNWPK